MKDWLKAVALLILMIFVSLFSWRNLKQESPVIPLTFAGSYCLALGYNLSIRTDEGGFLLEYCTFPDNKTCLAWDFLRGECGRNWTYCERVLHGVLLPSNKSYIFSNAPICKYDNRTDFDYKLFINLEGVRRL